jgi:peptidoglycan/xylan/chitin deacetylase (PgdA/CDA1 family)
MDFLMTVDVESFSIPLNRCDAGTARMVQQTGLPRLIDLFARHDMAATFYFTGEIVAQVPESVDLVKDHGHEIGCHGYFHDPDKAFDLLSFQDQLDQLTDAKKLIESAAGPIQSFRAPALRINGDTVKALETAKFTSDSSVCPQRFDGPFTFGSRKKLRWLVAPRRPYFLQNSTSILEIPISALILPYIGTMMRISPFLTRSLEKLLFVEAGATNKPLVFLFHPNECIEPAGEVLPTRRTTNPVAYVFADYLRQRMKLKNLGMKAVNLMDAVLSRAESSGARFMTVSAYRRTFR